MILALVLAGHETTAHLISDGTLALGAVNELMLDRRRSYEPPADTAARALPTSAVFANVETASFPFTRPMPVDDLVACWAPTAG